MEIVINLIYLSYIVYIHKIYALYKQYVLNSASETRQLQYYILQRPPLHTIHHNSEAFLPSLYRDIYSDINLSVVSTTNALLNMAIVLLYPEFSCSLCIFFLKHFTFGTMPRDNASVHCKNLSLILA